MINKKKKRYLINKFITKKRSQKNKLHYNKSRKLINNGLNNGLDNKKYSDSLLKSSEIFDFFKKQNNEFSQLIKNLDSPSKTSALSSSSNDADKIYSSGNSTIQDDLESKSNKKITLYKKKPNEKLNITKKINLHKKTLKRCIKGSRRYNNMCLDNCNTKEQRNRKTKRYDPK
jgi:hypothetical protein